MLSGFGHLAWRVVDGIVRGVLVLNLGSNPVLVLVLNLSFRLYSNTRTQGNESNKMQCAEKLLDAWLMHYGSKTDALWKHRKSTSEAQCYSTQYASRKMLQNMITIGYYESTWKITQVSYRTCSKRSYGLKVTPGTINMHKLKTTAT